MTHEYLPGVQTMITVTLTIIVTLVMDEWQVGGMNGKYEGCTLTGPWQLLTTVQPEDLAKNLNWHFNDDNYNSQISNFVLEIIKFILQRISNGDVKSYPHQISDNKVINVYSDSVGHVILELSKVSSIHS